MDESNLLDDLNRELDFERMGRIAGRRFTGTVTRVKNCVMIINIKF
jgi:hypothetical protein